jgi:hypothetical protein
VPNLLQRKLYSQGFVIHGRNPVGTISCPVFIEVILGSWNLANVKFSALNDKTKADASTEAHNAFAMAGEINWNEAADKAGEIVEQSGKKMQIKELGGIAGVRTVWGLSVSELSSHLGFGEDTSDMRRLVRAVEQFGHRCPELHKKGLKLCVAAEEAVSTAETVVYLLPGAGSSTSPGSLPAAMDARRPNSAQLRAEAAAPSSPPLGSNPRELQRMQSKEAAKRAIWGASQAQVDEWKHLVGSMKNTRELSPLKDMLHKPMAVQMNLSKQINEDFAKHLSSWQSKLCEVKQKATHRGRRQQLGMP